MLQETPWKANQRCLNFRGFWFSSWGTKSLVLGRKLSGIAMSELEISIPSRRLCGFVLSLTSVNAGYLEITQISLSQRETGCLFDQVLHPWAWGEHNTSVHLLTAVCVSTRVGKMVSPSCWTWLQWPGHSFLLSTWLGFGTLLILLKVILSFLDAFDLFFFFSTLPYRQMFLQGLGFFVLFVRTCSFCLWHWHMDFLFVWQTR